MTLNLNIGSLLSLKCESQSACPVGSGWVSRSHCLLEIWHWPGPNRRYGELSPVGAQATDAEKGTQSGSVQPPSTHLHTLLALGSVTFASQGTARVGLNESLSIHYENLAMLFSIRPCCIRPVIAHLRFTMTAAVLLSTCLF